MVGVDVLHGVLRHRDDAGQALGDPRLHLGEGVPAAFAHLFEQRAGVFDLELAVDGDRVVDGAEDRQPGTFEGQNSIAERLVVLHQVEVPDAVPQCLVGANRERQRLGKRPRAEGGHFGEVGERLDLPEAGHAARKVVVVDVQARQLVEWNPVVEFGVRISAEDLDVVSQVHQRLAEVAYVHALAATVLLAAIGQQCDT